jgi:DNA-binding NtrC family response regulator
MPPTRLVDVSHPAARVLIVDDEESICTLLTRMLEPLGYEIDIFTDADSTLAAVKDSPADVVKTVKKAVDAVGALQPRPQLRLVLPPAR